VTLIDVLEHVPDPRSLFAAIRARLDSEGIVAAVLPDAGSFTRRILGRRWPHYNAEHLYYWSGPCLERFLAHEGWRVRSLRRGRGASAARSSRVSAPWEGCACASRRARCC